MIFSSLTLRLRVLLSSSVVLKRALRKDSAALTSPFSFFSADGVAVVRHFVFTFTLSLRSEAHNDRQILKAEFVSGEVGRNPPSLPRFSLLQFCRHKLKINHRSDPRRLNASRAPAETCMRSFCFSSLLIWTGVSKTLPEAAWRSRCVIYAQQTQGVACVTRLDTLRLNLQHNDTTHSRLHRERTGFWTLLSESWTAGWSLNNLRKKHNKLLETQISRVLIYIRSIQRFIQ